MGTKIRALFSLTNKDGSEPFATGLSKLGYEIVSTGGTAEKLRLAGVTVTDVSAITGFKECFGGRVKTLHPVIHGGILYQSSKPEHVEQAEALGLHRIGLVVVNLYQFSQTVAQPGIQLAEALESIDIGGPSMLRGAAKNYEDVIVICDPADYGWVLSELQSTGNVSKDHRLALARKVFDYMARYEAAISTYLNAILGERVRHLTLLHGLPLAYGENRCQDPAFIYTGSDDPLRITSFRVLAGNPSFIAMADGSQLVDLTRLLADSFRRSFNRVPHIAIVGKHANPCGVGVDWDNPALALERALFGDPVAAMGGELITTFPVTDKLGTQLYLADEAKIGRKCWSLDMVLAPGISEATVELLGKKEKRRLLVNPELAGQIASRQGRIFRALPDGDFLEQMSSPFVFSPGEVQFWIGEPLQGDDLANLLIACACTWRASSNTVALAGDLQLKGLGCGQQDRIACGRLCLDRSNRANHQTSRSVFGSDGFFPFASAPLREDDLEFLLNQHRLVSENLKVAEGNERKMQLLTALAKEISRLDRREGPQLLADAGCIGGVVPADGQHLEEVKKFFTDAKMRVAFVAPENRGFARH